MICLYRIRLSIKGNWKQFLLIMTVLSLIFAVFFTIIMASFVVRHTSTSLYRRMQPQVTVIQDRQLFVNHFNKYGWFDNREGEYELQNMKLDEGVLQRIAKLPQVQKYDLFLSSRILAPGLYRFSFDEMMNERVRIISDLGWFYDVLGVSTPNFLVTQLDTMRISSGRTFNDDEIENNTPVVLISEDLAKLNGISIGSIITISNFLLDPQVADFSRRWLVKENFFWQESLDVEVIGLFDIGISDMPTHIIEERGFLFESALNSFIFPEVFVRMMTHNISEQYEKMSTSFEGEGFEEYQSFFHILSHNSPQRGLINYPIYTLFSADQIMPFTEQAATIIPEGFKLEFADNHLLSVVASFEQINQQIHQFLKVLGFATACSMILVVLLFMRMRYKEIKIYKYLGEQQNKTSKIVFFQLLIATGVSAVVAILLALLAGRSFSLQFIKNDLFAQVDTPIDVLSLSFFQRFGIGGVQTAVITMEEMPLTLPVIIMMICTFGFLIVAYMTMLVQMKVNSRKK